MKLLRLSGIALLVLGLGLIIASLIPPPSVGGGSFAGCVVIFFIPICFGIGNTNTTYLEALSALAVLMFVVLFLFLLYVNKRSVEASISR